MLRCRWQPCLSDEVLFCFVKTSRDFQKYRREKDGRTWRLEEHGMIAYGTFCKTASVHSLLVTDFVVGAFALGQKSEPGRKPVRRKHDDVEE